MIVRELITKLGFNVDEAKIKRHESAFNSLKGSLLSLVGKATLVTTAVTALFAAVGGGLFHFVRQTAELGDQAIKTSQKIGMSVESYQRLAYVAKLADVNQETLNTSLKFLSKNLVEATSGGKEASKAFTKLGINPKKYLNDTEGLLIAISDKISQMPDGAKKTALALELMGRSGSEMIPLLNGGGKEIRELSKEAELFGLIIKKDAAKQSEAFNDNLTRLGAIFTGLRNIIGQAFLPIFSKMVSGILAWYKVNHQIIKSKLNEWLERMIDTGKRLFPIFEQIGSSLSRIWNAFTQGESSIDWIGYLTSTLELSLRLLEKIFAAITWIIESPIGQFVTDTVKKWFEGLYLLYDDLAAYFRGDDSFVGEFINAAKKIVSEWIALFSHLFEFLKLRFLESAKLSAELMNPFKAYSAIQKLREGKAFSQSDAALTQLKGSYDSLQRRREEKGILTLAPGLESIFDAIQNIRKSPLPQTAETNLALLKNAGPSSFGSPALGAIQGGAVNTNSNNKTVQMENKVTVQLPEGFGADEIARRIESILGNLLRTANQATNSTVY